MEDQSRSWRLRVRRLGWRVKKAGCVRRRGVLAGLEGGVGMAIVRGKVLGGELVEWRSPAEGLGANGQG